MGATTSRLGLILPAGGSSGTIPGDDTIDVDDFNDNFRRLDESVGVTICTSTTRPASPFPGQPIYERNTAGLAVWDDQADDWVYLSGGNMPWMRLVKGDPITVTGATDVGWNQHQFLRGFTHTASGGADSVEVTIQKAGLYSFLVRLAEASPGDVPLTGRLFRNNVELSRFTADAPGSTSVWSKVTLQGTVDFAVGDKVKVRASTLGGTARQLEVSQCYWEMKYEGPVFS